MTREEDHVEWVSKVAQRLRSSFQVLMEREPTNREIGDLLGNFLLAMVSAQEEQEENDVSGT